MTLTEFLLARIAEDEAAQEPGCESVAWHRADCERNTYDAGPCDCGLPARVLAECEAKRRIVEWHREDLNETMSRDPDVHLCAWCDETWPCAHLRIVAAPYADHPDYQQEWKP